MSGHSKWHNIQARKGKQDALKSGAFSKLSKAITVTARLGGGDLDSNFSLRLAVEKARKTSMPKDKIEKAIKVGTGEDKDAAQIDEVLYEGYGPAGVAILVKTLTDNKNRTVSELKHLFSKSGGSLGEVGSVKWMFVQKGQITVQASQFIANRDNNELAIIEAGADDITEEDEYIKIYTKVEDLQKVLKKAEELGLEIEESKLDWVAKDLVPVPEEKTKLLENLFEALEENEDVEDYFTNAE